MVSSAIPVATIAIWDVTIEVGNVTETHEHKGELEVPQLEIYSTLLRSLPR
jgi:hypothetical protein